LNNLESTFLTSENNLGKPQMDVVIAFESISNM